MDSWRIAQPADSKSESLKVQVFSGLPLKSILRIDTIPNVSFNCIMNDDLELILNKQILKATTLLIKDQIRRKIEKLVKDDKQGLITPDVIVFMLKNGTI